MQQRLAARRKKLQTKTSIVEDEIEGSADRKRARAAARRTKHLNAPQTSKAAGITAFKSSFTPMIDVDEIYRDVPIGDLVIDVERSKSPNKDFIGHNDISVINNTTKNDTSMNLT